MSRTARVAVMLAVLVAAYGCANYGAIKPAHNEMTIEMLLNNWKDFDVSWTGLSLAEPTALMFDPKGNGKKLVGDIWHPVESKQSLIDFVGWLKANQTYYPSVWRILGPDGQFYGYLYTGCRLAAVKPVNKTTVWVYGIPPTLRGEDRDFMFKN
jgi:hypothetical protein